MAETYSVLTKLPLVDRILPPAARAYLAALRGFVSTVAITEPMYLEALDRCATRGLGSGAVFDAIHLVAAEAAGAELMLTFNERDFSRLATTGSPRVASSV
jgi:predicted nucleic acid-binding protein